MYWLASSCWNGRGDAVEVGALFGGTTRALGLGFAARQASDPFRFVPVARFGGYYDPRRLIETIGPLLERLGALERLRPRLQDGSFLEAFEAIHAQQPYRPFLRIVQSDHPDRPGEAIPPVLADAIDGIRDIGLLFFDRCKSWYSTKLVLGLLLAKVRPGGLVIFQDYGWYSCFWIPAFVASLGSVLGSFALVDGTRAFRLIAPVTGEEIARVFPDDPAAWGRARFDGPFSGLIAEASDAGDTEGLLRLGLQWASAIATRGDREDAKRLIDSYRTAAFASFESMVSRARRRPTYTPDGPIDLD